MPRAHRRPRPSSRARRVVLGVPAGAERRWAMSKQQSHRSDILSPMSKTKATTKAKTPNPHAQALGRLGGARNTDAQVAARKLNAKRAGRPGRVCATCGEPVLGGHKDHALDATCHGHTWKWAEPRSRKKAAS